MIRHALFFLLAADLSGATISGTVRDAQGGPVAGAALILYTKTAATGTETTSDSSGGYRFAGLAEGDYLIRAAKRGFAPQVADGIHIAGSTAVTRDLALAVASVHEQVVVTASSTPQGVDQVSKAVTTVDQTEADARDALAISETIDSAPGVRVKQLGGPGAFTTIQIRGMREQDTAVLVDGLRLRDASATQGDATGLIEDLLLTDTSRVEVMSGPGSSLYGTTAIGGVVNVITHEGGGEARGSLLLEGGSLGTFRGRAQVSGGLLGDRLTYSFGLADTNVVSGVGGDAPFRDLSAQGRVAYRISRGLRLTARLFGADSFSKVAGEPGILGSPTGFGIVDATKATFVPAPDNPDSTRAARFVTAALILNGQATPALDYSASYQLVSNGRRYGDGPAGTGYQPEGSTRSLYDGRIQTVNGQANYRIGFNLVTGGYEFERENFSNDNTNKSDPAAASGTNVTQLSHAFFVQDQAQFLGGRLQVSGAFRAQYFALDPPVFLPAASAPYRGGAFPAPAAAYTGDGSAAYAFRTTGTKLRAHVGRGYRAPSLYERFGAGFDAVYGYSVYGDPRLKPERSTSFDAGYDQNFVNGRVKVSGSYFYTWLQNVINFDTSGLIDSVSDRYGRYIGYLNSRGGISRGAEFSGSVAATRTLRVTAAYTYVNALERTPIVGNTIQTFVVPRNQFSVLLSEQATKRVLLTFDTIDSSSYLAPIYGDTVTQTYRFGGLHKVNAGASYRIPLTESHAVRLFVRAKNLFNQTYFENGFATAGRTAMAGMQYEF
jgi:outer membrane receptor protein involved in Fe transport